MPGRKSAKPKRVRRRRLPADQARARILGAAESKLAEVGPEGLRLTELAAELGVSHQAILHHFGSREGLVSAVLAQAIARINQRLAEAITGSNAVATRTLIDMIAEYYGAEGRARLLAWLELSEKAPHVHAATQAARPLEPLVALAHAQRKNAEPGRHVDLAETRFLCELAAFTLLGEALFGNLVRGAFGDTSDAANLRDFRRRFARLLVEAQRAS
jgi:AcrR family transcriptional regulator